MAGLPEGRRVCPLGNRNDDHRAAADGSADDAQRAQRKAERRIERGRRPGVEQALDLLVCCAVAGVGQRGYARCASLASRRARLEPPADERAASEEMRRAGRRLLRRGGAVLLKGGRKSEDFVEGPMAFAQKRAPAWKGR